MTVRWDTIIVGAGPVGVFLANLLGKAGLRTLVLDRDTAPYALPRAVHIDHEMVRLLADVGLAEEMLPLMRAGDGHIHIGADHGMIRFMSSRGAPRPYGYANDYFFNQPELEQVLRRGLGRFGHVTLRLGEEVTGVAQDDSQATVTLASGQTLAADYVVGTDGARSTVRKALGIHLDDLNFEEPWLVVDAEVDGRITYPDLTGIPESADLQNLSLMMCDPWRPATIVPGRGNHRRWEFMLLPGESETVMARPDVVADLVRPWVRDVPHRIIRATTYRFHGLVAENWHVGRVFLAGDAAHQTPPFFGQGLCHGLRDAAGLAWRLRLLQDGIAGPGLLDSYQTERDTQVRHVIGAAVEAGRYICELDPDKAAARDARLRAQTGIRSAAELIAPLRSDIICDNAGERFINPAAGDGRMLDDVTGRGWRLLRAAPVPAVSPVLDSLGAVTIDLAALPDREGHLDAWFDSRDAAAALVRPDFYVALIARDADDLDARLTALGTAMDLRLPGTA
ncbi:bifunctional 3-(3-hydroxy-phenyl)propionate/3-hydroxycinnamic acid hydroxylase [Wenxinia marina]|uniref:2-polyprenyl-6-methoxyphenol hydroxylase n=2 Tax=Wenxinia TaxID=653686 RepID=A0A0D0Q9G4_9RHOB|nr:bifunctional 3-(3-hydroxy-phenyl)propionate/3-hydroxycinnamic acid hydroxylase [Wenxinia marina]KIQ69007.1 2-polyprenyl-6-methoxyphenol hydroxylase [Wenxinia marina DSM 24838]GGL81055.1 3-(3-hydroxyphenyl)propionate hydroxylase [Wenxinia marina]